MITPYPEGKRASSFLFPSAQPHPTTPFPGIPTRGDQKRDTAWVAGRSVVRPTGILFLLHADMPPQDEVTIHQSPEQPKNCFDPLLLLPVFCMVGGGLGDWKLATSECVAAPDITRDWSIREGPAGWPRLEASSGEVSVHVQSVLIPPCTMELLVHVICEAIHKLMLHYFKKKKGKGEGGSSGLLRSLFSLVGFISFFFSFPLFFCCV